MLFNSYEFVFLFVPLSLLGYWAFSVGIGMRAAIGWLVAASLFFYSWWNPVYLPLLLASVLGNFLWGLWLSKRRERWLLGFGIAANLAALAYFKYTNFLLGSLDAVAGTDWNPPPIVLPLAISFFTFQQIAYLVDAYRGETREAGFVRYALFVTFFPQLIAGPIVHHRDMLPQFGAERFSPRALNLAIGLTIFSVGLFKKIVLADGIAPQSNALFRLAATGQELDFFLSWTAALSYTLQLYFDFSGYSDMAIGIARLFGIRLPMNFDSPLKSASLSEFWRRWHMTLSQFLRDYVYIPLGGGRGSPASTYLNMFLTMFLSGLWHGAGWTYIVWGIYHGVFSGLSMMWTRWREARGIRERLWWDRGVAVFLTFMVWTIGMVLFRADSLGTAGKLLAGMAGQHGAELPQHWQIALGPLSAPLQWFGIEFASSPRMLQATEILWMAALLLIVFTLPNIYAYTQRYEPAIRPARLPAPPLPRWAWQPNWIWLFAVAMLASTAIGNMSNVSEFLYFQF